jgi:hypothetical protein
MVHADDLDELYYITSFTVTELPAASVGNRFKFIVKVYTDFATAGVASDASESIILASVPDKPAAAPTRNTNTNENTVAINILTVPGDHGSTITSYNIEKDDGLGGSFSELQGDEFDSMDMTGVLNLGV